MGKTKPKYGQSNLDVAIQLSGQVDSLVDFCIKNNIENVDVVPDSNVEYEIKNINYAGYDYATNSSFIEESNVCQPVTGLVLDSFSGGNAAFSWNNENNCGFEYFLTETNSEPTGSGSITFFNEITISGLSSPEYYFWIRSICSFGDKSQFDSVYVNTIVYLTTEDGVYDLITEDGNLIIE